MAATGKPGVDGGIDLGRLHLPEVGGHHAEGHHEFGDVLVGGQAQGGPGGVQYIVLLGAQVVRQGAPSAATQVGLVDHLIIARHVVGASDNLVQPHRLAGQSVSPIERCKAGGGVVADAAEIVADLLAGHNLHIAGLLDAYIGVEALVGHSHLDNLAGKLDLHLDGGLVQAVKVCGLGLHDFVAAQWERPGGCNAVLVRLNRID